MNENTVEKVAYPDCISQKGIKEMEQAGYLRSYGAEDWLFCTEAPAGAGEDREQNTNNAHRECFCQAIGSSKAPPPDPSRIFKNWNTEANSSDMGNIPPACPEYEEEYGDKELPF